MRSPPIKEVLTKANTKYQDQVEHLEITYKEGVVKEVHLPLSVKQMIQLQKNDAQAKNIVDKL